MPKQMSMQKQSSSAMFMNLLFNIVVPVVILTKLSSETKLGPVYALLLALFFPIAYGAHSLWKEKKWNFMSTLGLVSVLLTGGLALLKLDGFWFAVKEAAIPAVIGLFVVFSVRSKYNVVRLMFLNPAVINLEILENTLENPKYRVAFDKLMNRTTLLLSSSFLLSAILNFALARFLLKSPSGTEAFNQELARMTALSFPVIMIPCMLILMATLFFFFRGIKKITGLELSELMHKQ